MRQTFQVHGFKYAYFTHTKYKINHHSIIPRDLFSVLHEKRDRENLEKKNVWFMSLLNCLNLNIEINLWLI